MNHIRYTPMIPITKFHRNTIYHIFFVLKKKGGGDNVEVQVLWEKVRNKRSSQHDYIGRKFIPSENLPSPRRNAMTKAPGGPRS